MSSRKSVKMKTIKLLEEITKIQERTIAAEKTVSNNILNRWHEQEQIITDWKYSYWKLERKFEKALEDIRFLNHYIEQKNLKKSSIDERTDSNKGKSNTNLKANQREIGINGKEK